MKQDDFSDAISLMLLGGDHELEIRKRRKRTLITRKQRKRKKDSARQKEHIEKFKEAVQYARHVIKNPDLRAKYQAKVNARQTSAYTVALGDYMNAPVIHYIKVSGDMITVKASDDFMVVRVEVEILDANGKIIEKADAERYKRHHLIWKYKTSGAKLSEPGSMIRAKATDTPGNMATSEVMS